MLEKAAQLSLLDFTYQRKIIIIIIVTTEVL
jgi:hypothetical protein